ncbi:MAG: hypothetical protein UT37_C0012G0015 [Parcubacteria group bacterium GW2011_GWA2_39_18]|nr:MAG: hypothetical protein UT37_C0012G0015 [Parcubacteria group bacterium GW2011_GWA2_39_18]
MSFTILLVVLLIVAAWAVLSYNFFITLINRTKEAWSDIDVQLKRRHDLIPNLIETVKGYMAHEKNILEDVTKARAQALSAQNLTEKDSAENQLSHTLKSLFAVSENYPQLKASENFLELQRELADTENKIQAARRFYNGNVRDLNIQIEKFPPSLIARLFHFSKMELFGLENPAEKEVPKVSFK